MTAGPRARRPALAAITFDFGNTLVPVDRAALEAVVRALADAATPAFGVDREGFLRAWGEERARQFREEVPRFREVDLTVRLRRVLARLRGMPVPGPAEPWDDGAAGALSTPREVAFGIDVYSAAFGVGVPPDPAIEPFLARLAGRYRLGILSNWPLAATIDRYADAAGWAPHLAAVVVSERVGTIKPHPAIFRAAEAALALPGDPPVVPGAILHVGDDWAADVVGAHGAGWRVAYLRGRPANSPLPGSEPDGEVAPDLVLDELAGLEPALARLGARPRARPGRAPARDVGRKPSTGPFDP